MNFFSKWTKPFLPAYEQFYNVKVRTMTFFRKFINIQLIFKLIKLRMKIPFIHVSVQSRRVTTHFTFTISVLQTCLCCVSFCDLYLYIFKIFQEN